MSEHAKALRSIALTPECCDECRAVLAGAAELERLEAENALLRRSLEMLSKPEPVDA